MKKLKNVGTGPVYAQKGITLIALIITIIVMLILVAVTISMAINGGLFNYAGKAAKDTQNALDAEHALANGKVNVGGTWYDSIDDYINEGNVNWEEILAKVKAEPDKYLQEAAALGQDITKNTLIGFGTNGKVVNLDLWYYQKENGAYDLVNPNNAQAVYSAYKGKIIEGKIQGTVPQYFYSTSVDPYDNGVVEFVPVTQMSYTFIGLKDLTSMPEIPCTVTKLFHTFRQTGLSHVTIPEHVTNIFASFIMCESLLEVSIPNGVTELDSAFSDCIRLKSVTIPSSVTSLKQAFERCTGLQSVTFEGTPAEIGSRAFDGCTGLEDLRIPSGVQIIGNYAFRNVPHVSYTGSATGSPWGADSIN